MIWITFGVVAEETTGTIALPPTFAPDTSATTQTTITEPIPLDASASTPTTPSAALATSDTSASLTISDTSPTLTLPTEAEDTTNSAIRATAMVDTTETLVGQPFTARIRVHWAAPVQPVAYEATRQIGNFDVLDAKALPDQRANDEFQERTVQLTLACFEPGDQELPSIEIAYVDAVTTAGASQSAASQAIHVVRTSPVTVHIRSRVADLEATSGGKAVEPRPAAPPLELPFPYRRWLIAGGVALAILIAMAVAWWFMRRYLRGRAVAPQTGPSTPLLEPDEEALRALAEMETTGMLERDTAKAVYSQLSFILRRYLERRHRFNALEMTSSEVLRTVSDIGWTEDLWRLLRQDLNEADTVKFARYAPSLTIRRDALERVREIVKQTRPATTLLSVVEAKAVEGE